MNDFINIRGTYQFEYNQGREIGKHCERIGFEQDLTNVTQAFKDGYHDGVQWQRESQKVGK